MAKERKASVIYEGNASQLVYAFPFEYLRKAFVKVEDIYTNIAELIQGIDYTVSDKQITLTTAIPLSHTIKIYRETTTDPLVEWQDASVLRSSDLTLQEVQLLHLAEETADKVFDSGMSTSYSNPNVWDGQYKRISNLLDPIEAGDAVTLRYITATQSSLINQLKNTGAAQNTSIVATGDTQNKLVTNTGDTYVATMTTLKSDAATQANLAKAWAQSDTSPDGVSGNKSSKTWASEAKASASAAATSETNAAASAKQTTLDKAATAANVKSCSGYVSDTKKYQETTASYVTNAQDAALAASESSVNAALSATNAAASATAAAKSATAAAASADKAATFEPEKYYNKLLRNTAYAVGDIAYSSNLPSYLYLECTTAGTTGTSEPDWDTAKMGGVNSDGTAKFRVRTVLQMPAGAVLPFAGNTVPKGWLLCNGQAVSRTDYDELFEVIGTTYGTGDGSTTFNLPNLVDKFVEGGSTSGTVKSAGLPNISGSTSWGVNGIVGTYSGQSWAYSRSDGALSVSKEGKAFGCIGASGADSASSNVAVAIDASKSNSIYGASTTVQPPAIVMKYIIKA